MKLTYIFSFSCFLLLTACGGGGGDSSPAQSKVNNPPVANNDNFTVGMNASAELDVLVNDNDSDSLTLTEVTSPTNGVLDNNQTNLTYTPNSGYVGSDSFTYTITDTVGQKSSATVTVNVTNIAPIAENDVVTTVQSKAVSIDVLANDISKGGHQLTIASTSSASNGVISHDGQLLTYTPSNGFSGNDAFTYIVRDSHGDESTASVGVTIENLIPVAHDDSVNSQQNSAIVIDVLANDIDATGDNIEVVSVDAASQGIASIEENKIVYTPNDGFAGIETINYTIVDAYGASNQATITIDITNTAPIANDDNGVVLKNGSVTLDILSNDEDVVGDAFTIQSLSSPLHGSVSIVDGKVVYQPTTDYVGNDSFGYTITDSYGSSASAFIAINVLADITLQGKVIGYEKAGLTVTVLSGDNENTAITNDQGEYTISLTSLNNESIVIAKVDGAAPNFTMYAYLGDGANFTKSLNNKYNNTLFIENQNITDLTTAEYELIDIARNGVKTKTLNELTAAQYEADNYYQLQMTIATRLINQNNNVDLPKNFTSVNSFIKSITALRKQLVIWEEEHYDLYHQAFSELSTNNELSSYPDRLTPGDHFLATSAEAEGQNNSFGYAIHLSLHANNSGKFLDSDQQQITEWQQSGNSLTIALSPPEPNFSNRQKQYCADESISNLFFDIANMELSKIYSTTQYDVYLQKITTIDEGYYHCGVTVGESTLYNTVRHYHQQSFTPDLSGTVLLNKYRIDNTVTEDKVPKSELAKVSFTNDGSFIDNADENNVLAGTWLLENNTLRLDYNEGFSMLYKRINTYQNLPNLQVFYIKDEIVLRVGQSYLLATTPLAFPYSTGAISWDISPIFDSEMTPKSRWLFYNDNSGEVQSLINSVWQYDNVLKYSWSLNENTYTFNAYKLDSENVAFCDVSQSNCYLYIKYQFQIIAKTNKLYALRWRSQWFDEDSDEDSSEMWNNNYRGYSLVTFTP